ncbi:MAG: DDE-type integrase/transposase/recombinase, partial [Candidatus Bathyarchaeia archaeon]
KWVRKYSKLISGYMQGLDIEFGDRWSADESVIKVNSRHLRLWALMDNETKLLIAQKLSEKRTSSEAEALLEKGIENANKVPLELITDGFTGYHEALEKLSAKIKKQSDEGIVHLFGPLTGEVNNNLIERLFGELKQRISTMRGIKSEKSFSDFLEGLLSIYNISKLTPEKIDLLRIIEKAYLNQEKRKGKR